MSIVFKVVSSGSSELSRKNGHMQTQELLRNGAGCLLFGCHDGGEGSVELSSCDALGVPSRRHSSVW